MESPVILWSIAENGVWLEIIQDHSFRLAHFICLIIFSKQMEGTEMLDIISLYPIF